MLLVFIPIPSVLSSQLVTFGSPVSALAMTLILGPHTLILILVLVELDTETFLKVISPVT